MECLYKTPDYGIAGYLFARGFDLNSLERNGMQIVFCFERSDQLFDALDDHCDNKLIPCRDHFNGLKKAKAIIQESIKQVKSPGAGVAKR